MQVAIYSAVVLGIIPWQVMMGQMSSDTAIRGLLNPFVAVQELTYIYTGGLYGSKPPGFDEWMASANPSKDRL